MPTLSQKVLYLAVPSIDAVSSSINVIIGFLVALVKR